MQPPAPTADSEDQITHPADPENQIVHPADSLNSSPHPADNIDVSHPADSLAGPTGGPTGAPPEGSAPGPTAGPEGTFSSTAGVEDAKAKKKPRRQEVEELRELVKKSRWNVYLFLGIGAILFIFALFPLSTPGIWEDSNLKSDSFSSLGTVETPLSILGIPGMNVEVSVEVWVMDNHGGDIEVFLIPEACNDPNIVYSQSNMRDESSQGYYLLENAAPGSHNTVELETNPIGAHCLIVEYLEGEDARDESLEVATHVYMLRVPLGIFAILSLGWAAFGFLGAQKSGNKLKELATPKSASVETQVIDAARQAKLASGPSAPPAPTSGPPSATPPAAGPPTTTPPAEPIATETASGQADPLTPAIAQPNYVGTGDGYFYIQNPDGSFEPEAYYQSPDGKYIIFEG